MAIKEILQNDTIIKLVYKYLINPVFLGNHISYTISKCILVGLVLILSYTAVFIKLLHDDLVGALCLLMTFILIYFFVIMIENTEEEEIRKNYDNKRNIPERYYRQYSLPYIGIGFPSHYRTYILVTFSRNGDSQVSILNNNNNFVICHGLWSIH